MAGLRELYLQAIEAYNAHDLDTFLGYYADDCELTVPGFPPFQGKAAARECWRLFLEAFPDDHLTITSQLGGGDHGGGRVDGAGDQYRAAVSTVWERAAANRQAIH